MLGSNDTYISLEELKAISGSLESQKDMIYNDYKTQIIPILESTRGCFAVAGVDYGFIEQAFNSTFETLNSRYDELINILNNNVIKGYSDTVDVLRQLFNKDFASQLQSILRPDAEAPVDPRPPHYVR